MNKVLLLIIVALTISCTNKKDDAAAKCLPGGYKEAIKRGEAPNKTTTFQIKDTVYMLDYVRGHTDEWPAYGYLDTDANVFRDILNHAGLLPAYPLVKNVHSLIFFAGVDDIEKGTMLNWNNVAAYAIVYKNAESYMLMDFVNTQHITQTYRISQSYASVKNYLLRERSGITVNPAIIEIVNLGFDRANLKMIPQSEDKLYKEAEASK